MDQESPSATDQTESPCLPYGQQISWYTGKGLKYINNFI